MWPEHVAERPASSPVGRGRPGDCRPGRGAVFTLPTSWYLRPFCAARCSALLCPPLRGRERAVGRSGAGQLSESPLAAAPGRLRPAPCSLAQGQHCPELVRNAEALGPART